MHCRKVGPLPGGEAKGICHLLRVNHVVLSGQSLAGVDPGDKSVCRQP